MFVSSLGSLGPWVTASLASPTHCLFVSSSTLPLLVWCYCTGYSVFAFLRKQPSNLEPSPGNCSRAGAAPVPGTTLFFESWRVNCQLWVALSLAQTASGLEHVITIVSIESLGIPTAQVGQGQVCTSVGDSARGVPWMSLNVLLGSNHFFLQQVIYPIESSRAGHWLPPGGAIGSSSKSLNTG